MEMDIGNGEQLNLVKDLSYMILNCRWKGPHLSLFPTVAHRIGNYSLSSSWLMR